MAFNFKKAYKEFYMPKRYTGDCDGSEGKLYCSKRKGESK